MKRNTISPTKTINIVCAVLMLALLVCQFIPFWSVGEQYVSIGGYVWFPEDHGDLTVHLQESLNNSDFTAGSIVWIHLIMLLVSAAGFAFCLKNSDAVWPAVFPAVCGVVGICGYITQPVLQMGAAWPLHLVLSIVTLVLAVVSLVCKYKENHAKA